MSDRNTHVFDQRGTRSLLSRSSQTFEHRGGTWRTSRPRTSIRTIRTTTAAFPQMMLLPSERAFAAMSMSPIFAPGLGDRLGVFHAGLAEVTGIDLNPARVHGVAELTALVGLEKASRVRVIEGDVTRTGLPSAAFDVVVSQEAFLHVPDKAAAVAEAFRLLQPARGWPSRTG